MHKSHTIALLIPSLKAGGMERVMSELANFFVTKKNITVHLILYGRFPEIFYDIHETLIIHKPKKQFNNRLRIYSSLKRLIYVRQTVKSINPDTVLSFGTLWNRFILLALLGTGYPVFVSDRGNPQKKQSVFQELLAKILYPTAAGIIAQTQKAKNIYQKKKLNKNIAVIGNPVKFIDPSPTQKENIILSVGRLISSKHHDRLIKIFSNIFAPDWKLIIVGGDAGKEKNMNKLKQLINELNLQSRVIMTGETNKVTEYYKKAKIFAFTSSSEGFPNVIGEALYAGLPVVSYDCPVGPSEMIRNGENGFLIPLFDDSLFQEKLQLLIDDEELRSKLEMTAKKTMQKFSITNIGSEYLNFILPENN